MTYLTTFDKRQLRDVLGAFTTGVTIVTTRNAVGKAFGVTANSFSSVSLEPPLVLWSQSLTSSSLEAFQSSDCFAVNILADDQVELSNHFAKSHEDKFMGVAHSDGFNGVPVLGGTAAHLECSKVATYPGGDHVVYLGRVERVGFSHRRPLAFVGGRYMVPYAHDLGPVALQLGSARIACPAAIHNVVGAMASISHEVGLHSLCLAVWGNHGPTTIYWEPSSRPVSGNFPTGLVLNVTSTALGRAFVAFLPPDVTRKFVDEDLRLFRKADEDPEAQRHAFDAEIAATRDRGVSCATVAHSSSLVHKVPTHAFAAPIFDASGSMLMAISMIAHIDHLGGDPDAAGPRALKSACEKLSRKLGHVTP